MMPTTKGRGMSTVTAPPLPLTVSVPEAGKLLGIGRNASYNAAKRGDIPTIRIGGLLRVPTHKLLAIMNGEGEDSA